METSENSVHWEIKNWFGRHIPKTWGLSTTVSALQVTKYYFPSKVCIEVFRFSFSLVFVFHIHLFSNKPYMWLYFYCMMCLESIHHNYHLENALIFKVWDEGQINRHTRLTLLAWFIQEPLHDPQGTSKPVSWQISHRYSAQCLP